jgi:carboxylesterase type B
MAQLDGGPPVTAGNYQAMIASTLGGPPTAAAAAMAAEYPLTSYSSPSVALGAVGTDAIFACPVLTAEESLSKYTPTYAYEFNDENAPELFLAPVGWRRITQPSTTARSGPAPAEGPAGSSPVNRNILRS